MKKSFRSIFSILLLMIITLQLSVPALAGTSTYTYGDAQVNNYMKSIVDFIKTKYNGNYDEDKVLNESLKGIFNSFDPYTTFYTKEEAAQFFSTMSGQYSGIGIGMAFSGKKTIVSNVYPNSPAEKAGILIGDILFSVNGLDLSTVENSKVSSYILGEKGTELNIIVDRNGEKKSFKLARDTISIKPGTYNIENDIGYIKLEMFNDNSADFITEALQYMDSKGIEKIILDLRNNPGGEVDQAVRIAQNFIPKGNIVTLDFKDNSTEDKKYSSNLEKLKYKLAVLVNGNSASASEILTGAVQDTKAGVIVGTKTFGKAKVQTTIPILTPEAYEKYSKKLGKNIVDAYELYTKYNIDPKEDEILGWTKMTTGRYYTPNGRMIDLIGLEPDINIADLPLEFDINTVSSIISDIDSKDGVLPEDIVNLKKILSMAGYRIDDYSNTFDSYTSKELERYQKDFNLEQTGKLDSPTRVGLNKMLISAKKLIDRGYGKAVEVLNTPAN